MIVQLCGYSGTVGHKEGGNQVLLLLSWLSLLAWYQLNALDYFCEAS